MSNPSGVRTCCGDGIMGRMDKTLRNELVGLFFDLQGLRLDRCLEPSEECELGTIRGHSIPSGTVLRHLSKDGHVVALQQSGKLDLELSYHLLGKKKATTFSGLCSKHDSEIFRPIDTQLPDLRSQRHLFLLAYRAVLRETYEATLAALKTQLMYQKTVEVGLAPGHEPCSRGLAATGLILRAMDSYEYKRIFDGCYLSNEWSQLSHRVLVLEDQAASIAVSALFSLDDACAPVLPRVALSLFPRCNDVAVVFSALPRDTPSMDEYIHRIRTSEAHLQRYLLTKLIVQNCDNFVIHPDYYDGMSPERRNAIRHYSARTVLRNDEEHEDPAVYLF